MTGQISEAKIAEVRERTDIVELVGQYVSLKRSGANHMGLCPFHSEKSPSFSVNAARQFFHCFGCGVGGDVFSFLMQIEGMAFPDAVRRLAERAGIELEERTLSPEEERLRQQRERLYQVNKVAAAYFHDLLMEQPAGEVARQYLKRRGYGRKAAGEYGIGYSLDSWEGLREHLVGHKLAPEDARLLGLIRPGKQDRGDYDLFRGRLMFPIHDMAGRVVAFGGRVLDDSKPKYINSPESPIYHKGQVLFGLYQARQAMRQQEEVLLVEGYFDQLALNRAGFAHAVATCGTALTVDHARVLKRYVKRVVLLFDQDSAGQQATFKAMTTLQAEGVPAVVLELPEGEDPDSFLHHQGRNAFQARLDAARPVMDLFISVTLAASGSSIEAKADAAEVVVERISSLQSQLEQDLYLKELAQRSNIDLDILKSLLAEKKNVQVVKKYERQKAPESLPTEEAGYDVPPPADYPVPDYDVPDFVPAEDYGYIAPEHNVGMSRSTQNRQRSGAKKTWSRTEQTLLSLLVHKLVPRQRMLENGGDDLFSHPEMKTIASKILCLPEEQDFEPEVLLEQLGPQEQELVLQLINIDKAQFAETSEVLFTDCLAALKRDQKKRRREELLTRIRELEGAGQTDLVKDLLEELQKLK